MAASCAAEPGREGGPGAGQLGFQPFDAVNLPPSISRPPRGPSPAATRQLLLRGPASSPSSLRRSAAARPRPTAGPSRHPGRDQVVAVDLELHVPPFQQVAVEPIGAQRARKDQDDRVATARQLDRGRGPLRSSQPPAAPRRREGPSAAASTASSRRDEPRPRRAAEQLCNPPRQLDAARRAARPGPSRRAARSRAPPPVRRRAASAPPVAGRRRRVPRSVVAQQRLGLRLQLESEPGRVAGRPQRPGRVVDEGAGVQDAQQAGFEVGSAAVRVDQPSARPRAGSPSR